MGYKRVTLTPQQQARIPEIRAAIRQAIDSGNYTHSEIAEQLRVKSSTLSSWLIGRMTGVGFVSCEAWIRELNLHFPDGLPNRVKVDFRLPNGMELQASVKPEVERNQRDPLLTDSRQIADLVIAKARAEGLSARPSAIADAIGVEEEEVKALLKGDLEQSNSLSVIRDWALAG